MTQIKEVFKAYGIDYVNGKLNYNGALIPLPLKDGNSKLGKGVYTWSMLPTCNNGGTCFCNCSGCYATKGFYNMSSTKAALVRNTAIAKSNLTWLENAIKAQIASSNGKIKFVRIHAAGDFFSGEYTEMWVRIAESFPEVVFWTYTKSYGHGFDDSLNRLDSLKNANIVRSFANGKVNFGHAGYIMALYRDLVAAGKSVWICRCGIDKNQHCNNCHHCATSEYVLFLEHSTGYKPEDDPDFAEFIELVNSQIED